MSRPVNKVTVNNFYTVQSYFQNLLERKGLFGSEQWDDERKAKKAFNSLSRPAYTKDFKIIEKSQEIAIDDLQSWISKYAGHQWPKFLALERQRRFKGKNRMKALELHYQAYLQLKSYAEKVNLSLSDAIEKLAKAELDKLQKAEWKQNK